MSLLEEFQFVFDGLKHFNDKAALLKHNFQYYAALQKSKVIHPKGHWSVDSYFGDMTLKDYAKLEKKALLKLRRNTEDSYLYYIIGRYVKLHNLILKGWDHIETYTSPIDPKKEGANPLC